MDVHVCFINKINATTFVKSSDLFRSYTELCKSIKIILKPQLWGPKIILDKSPYSMQYLAVFASAAIFPVFFCIVIHRFIIEIMKLILPYLASEYIRRTGGERVETDRFKIFGHQLLKPTASHLGNFGNAIFGIENESEGFVGIPVNRTIPLQILSTKAIDRSPDSLPAVKTAHKILLENSRDYAKWYRSEVLSKVKSSKIRGKRVKNRVNINRQPKL